MYSQYSFEVSTSFRGVQEFVATQHSRDRPRDALRRGGPFEDLGVGRGGALHTVELRTSYRARALGGAKLGPSERVVRTDPATVERAGSHASRTRASRVIRRLFPCHFGGPLRPSLERPLTNSAPDQSPRRVASLKGECSRQTTHASPPLFQVADSPLQVLGVRRRGRQTLS